MDTKEVVHCALQIEKLTVEKSYESIMTLVSDLDACRVTAEQLETTDIVKVLYRLLKTCSDNNVKRKVKSMLSRWKKQHGEDGRGGKCSDGRKVSEEAGVSERGDSQSGQALTCDHEEQQECPQAKPDLQSQISCAASSSVRSKCVELLLSALHPEPPDGDKAAELAESIELHLHELHAPNQVKYKTCVRSKVANLKNPNNSHLRRGLLGGSLRPEEFARMSVEEMACSELRQLRQEFSTRAVSERQLPQGVEGTQTQKIRCQRCGGSDCRVTQMSRGALFLPAWVRRGGADEDAMTFVTCSGCGQQWYHSGWVCL
ncbi:transcription elongation factor A N-terminal and central domain-containing protein [Cololabis saira]|uniref:transcription elongation factor A N-terminal and central domain-containing protein n=1 Tax=Cololabis saira TaxID=129043 RepID=UPI002AD3F7E0|nr:transcription elongation factor A N-terminal and central domain-containing protein [Cololabis saira]